MGDLYRTNTVARTAVLLGEKSRTTVNNDHPAVTFGVRTSGTVGFRDRLDAMSLLYPTGVFVGPTAAAIHRVPFTDLDGPIHMWLPENRHRKDLVVRRTRLAATDILLRHNLRVTTGVRTAVDQARYLPGDDGVIALDQCLRSGIATRRAIDCYLATARQWRSKRAYEALTEADARSESPYETRTRLLLHRKGLRVLVPQVVVLDGRYRLDLGAEEYRVAVEYDGAIHRGSARHRDDVERWNTLQHDLGWVVILVTAGSLHGRPQKLVERVAAALQTRGWRPNVS